WLNSSSYPAFTNGKFFGVQGVLSDITERKQAEEALQKSEEKFRIVADYTYDWEYWITPEGTYAYMSPSCERITGYSASEFYKNPSLFDEIIHPDDNAAYCEHMELSYVSSSPESVEYRIVRKDGGIRWISHICQPMYNRKGELLGRRSSNRDATEHKQAEMALQESEEKYRAFFATSMDCVFITTREGKWIDFNDATIDLFGYDSRIELKNIAIRDLYADPDVRDAHIRYISERGHSLEYPVNLRKKDGTVINTLITSIARKDSDGNTLGFQGSIRDITEKKITQDRIEELLRLQEEQLRIINTSPAVAFLWKAEENWPVEMVTRNISQFGYSVDDFKSGRVLYSSIIHADDFGRVGAEVTYNSANNIDEFIQVYRILGKDRSEYWIEDYTHIRRDKTGKITHYEGIVIDITQRKRAEEEIKRSIERFRTVMDSIDAFVYVADMKTYELLFINKYGRDIWGEIEGKVCWQTIQSGQDRPCPFCTNDRLVDDNENPTGIYNWEFQNTVNGHWYDCRDSAIRWLDGLLVRIEIATDITGRKQIEGALRESEQKFRDLFENSRDGIVIADLRTKKFVDSNDMFSRMLGYSPEEIKDLGLMEIHPEGDRSLAFEVFEKMVRREMNIAENLPVRRKDGMIFYADISAYPINISGKDYLVGVFRDITERRQAEELKKHFTEELELQVKSRTQDLETSLDEKIVLLREIHHRVKNNLQIIISLVNLQMRKIEDPQLKQVMTETKNRVRAMSLVHEKLYQSENFSRIDFADYTRFLATQLISYYGTDFRRVQLDFAMREIMVDINTAVPLGLLINELISNALKHAFLQGREGTISISGGSDGDLITLVVRDNGIGIPPDLDWKNTTSLGMRLVTSLVDQIDGTITLDRNQGTAFTITVRRKPASEGA
ncbi:MAG: PAS domain S-box protein, partial [Methanoregula sp.]|nr:PAS domain S-box protein [Methanoregula sp.]